MRLRKHPVAYKRWSFGQKASDKLTSIMGSWLFIGLFLLFLIFWMMTNTYFLVIYNNGQVWDPYPFILLNLMLSCLAAIQAPIILMSQNRASEKDRVRAEYDYKVNRKAEREVEDIKKKLERIERRILVNHRPAKRRKKS